MRRSFVGLLALALFVNSSWAAEKDAEHAAKMTKGLKLFKAEVRGVLVGRCVKCHGGEETEGEFDLATRAALLTGGAEGKAVELGNGKASRLYKLIAHQAEPSMPEDGAKLDDCIIASIANWIDLGAPYDRPLAVKEDDPLAWTRRTIDEGARDYWAFQPLQVAEPPVVESDSWSRTGIDRYILAKLRQNKLTPNNPIDRRRLIRRAYFDLIGLPPTPAEIERFEQESVRNPQSAFDNLVDRLLDDPHYGERWGRHWLDVARFGESHGFEQDYDRPHAYHYRDFVIKALNSNMPYDQFVRWQIAGDEIEPDSSLAMMATGFLGAGVFPTQLTEKEFEQARYDELDDMVATLGTSMLGLTVGCARCHDHKFDPIPSRDYYRMISSFTTTIRSEIDLELGTKSTKQALAEWQKKHDPLVAARTQFERDELPKQFDKWLASRPKGQSLAPKWIVLDMVEHKSAGGATLSKLDDGSLLATGTNPDFDKYTFVAHTNLSGITAIRLEALAHESMVRKGPGRAGNGNMGLGNFTVRAEPLSGEGESLTLKLANPVATFQQNTSNLSIAASIDKDVRTGWAVDSQFGKDHAAVFETVGDIGFQGGTKLTFTMEFNVNNKHNIGRPRLSVSTSPRPVGLKKDSQHQSVVEILAVLNQSNGKLTDQQRQTLLKWFRTSNADWRGLDAKVQQSLAVKPKPQMTKVMVSSEGFKPIKHHADGRGFPHFYKQTHFLKRGDANQKVGVADQGFLQVLMTSPSGQDHWHADPPENWRTSYRRTSLAAWITDTEHGAGHLLARVIANRIWHLHMGRGIVATPNDFGFQGERPTHPELLDWLASKLIASGWDLKAFHKLMMTSAVYQQSSEFDQADFRVDPQNKWCWRFSPRRLEAEIIRDSMLSVGGELDRTMFGRGTLDERMKRRSIYFMIKRSKLIPMMQIFDSPEPLVSVGDRPSTTIAPQALLFMNNSNVRGYARSFARSLASTAEKSLANAVITGYIAAIGRPPNDDELNGNVAFIESQTKSYQSDNQNPPRELALADFCQVLMCLNEFIYID